VDLHVNKLSKQFGGLAAVDEVSFDLLEGEILGLIGPNGAGKTTLFNLITGFIAPSSGQVVYQGEDISCLPPYRIAARGMVRTFQVTNLFPNLRVYDSAWVGRHLKHGMGIWGPLFGSKRSQQRRRSNDDKVMELLSLVGLDTLKDELVRNLPHGHQNLLQIVSALAAEPKVLLLDEPAGGLNPEETSQMASLIRRIRGMGITVLLVEHNMRVVMGICDRIVALNYGRKIAEGSPAVISRNRDVIDAYLGSADVA
jgi:branched-chain amino acid transport system ATP-binding protein